VLGEAGYGERVEPVAKWDDGAWLAAQRQGRLWVDLRLFGAWFERKIPRVASERIEGLCERSDNVGSFPKRRVVHWQREV
jgi:hypothetical protein